MGANAERRGGVEIVSVHPLQKELWAVLGATTLESGYLPDRVRQQAIFDRIKWDSFVQEAIHEGTEGKQVRGKVFEMLINADPAFGQRSPLELELLALAHNPSKFGLQDILGQYRNPDMAFIVTQIDDHAVIAGIGEAKLGLLNTRAYKQLSETGFARGVAALVEVVNSLPDPASYGLVEVAKAGPLTIAPDFSQLLVVPANRKVEWKSKLVNYRDFPDPVERKEMYALLGDPDRVTIKKAAFSTAEVGAVAARLAFLLNQ